MKAGSNRTCPVGAAMAAMALMLFCWFGEAHAARISLNGTSGLLITPTANVVEDRTVLAGVSFVDKKWAVEGRDQYDNIAYFGTMGFLPRLEVSFRLTVLSGSVFSLEDPDRTVKDRMLSVKALLLRERAPWPSLAVGGEDLTGTKRFNTLFAVMGKHFELGPAGEFELHLGAGGGWMEAKNHHLDGVFGGLTKQLWEGGELIVEYDTDKVNVGVSVEPVAHFRVLLSAMNAESFAGSFQVGFSL